LSNFNTKNLRRYIRKLSFDGLFFSLSLSLSLFLPLTKIKFKFFFPSFFSKFFFPKHTHSRSIKTSTPFFRLCRGQGAARASAHENFYRGLVISGKTNLPVSLKGLSLKRSQCEFWTALPCTTPRPALESSTNDLASDLWVLAQPCGCAYFSRVKKGEANRRVTGTPVADTQHSRRRTSPPENRGSRMKRRPGIRPKRNEKAGTPSLMERVLNL